MRSIADEQLHDTRRMHDQGEEWRYVSITPVLRPTWAIYETKTDFTFREVHCWAVIEETSRHVGPDDRHPRAVCGLVATDWETGDLELADDLHAETFLKYVTSDPEKFIEEMKAEIEAEAKAKAEATA